jgi:hypothetical protein
LGGFEPLLSIVIIPLIFALKSFACISRHQDDIPLFEPFDGYCHNMLPVITLLPSFLNQAYLFNRQARMVYTIIVVLKT